ncbi:GAF and ANTAR domain-containing protein [Salsipaludibacter albus]|uniref:GAF and ANTAR domain-containing protein n=1 Tax=Salsipaludibacter albus TaxID=2849650 RepID=UPI001EE3D2EA|nr:GAF and ANTAR domain-containing protein [Salsipaludibacter albus]MBY5161495.1 GAF and ANTAR domain-containing protein [Salsipaludibacter albus]
MVDQHALVGAFEDFADATLHAYDIGEMLYRVTDQVVEVLDIDGAGVSLARGGEALQFVTATDRRAATIEDAQLSEREGPCQQAFHDGKQVAVGDLEEDCPWPDYGRAALDRGIRAVAGLPMPVGRDRIGAMDLYRAAPGPWTDEELRVAQLLADMASGYILNNMELSESRSLTMQLQEALDSRVVIEQAKGMISGRSDMSPNEAFELLRRHARSTGTRLHDLCRGVVDGDVTPADLHA